MKTKLFITGGTIDARYNYLKAKVDYDKTRINEMLAQGRSRVDVDVEQLMLIDSVDITDEERQKILDKCKSAEERKIVITHGTDTLVETAKFLGPSVDNKTIVLVGAMIPYTFKQSDALFQMLSLISAQL